MPSRAMVVVGGGSSTRLGIDKLMVEVAGRPMISHTIEAVHDHVDVCVVVCRSDIRSAVAELHPGVITVDGGPSRTRSEIAGLDALPDQADLIGIHDAARPLLPSALIGQLFEVADARGGAVPLLANTRLVIDSTTGEPIEDLHRAQTPQVFRGIELIAAYRRAAVEGFEAHDSVEVVERFGELEVVAVPGDPGNIKVTYPADLEKVRTILEGPSRT